MEEVFSKGKDCQWLAQQLKNQMGGYVSFNEFGIDNPILTGVYIKNGLGGGPYYGKEDVRFYIKFCKNEFLRIQIEFGCNSNEDIALAMYGLIEALASIKQKDTLIGYPLAIYEISDCLTSEYAFKNLETVIESLKNNAMFDDDDDINNLKFLRTYTLEESSGKQTLCCNNGGCDTQIQENETCLNHGSEDGERPYIKSLCRSICDDKR